MTMSRSSSAFICKMIAVSLFSALLGACSSSGDLSRGARDDGDTRELATGSDQTEQQKRARIRLQLAMGYYEQRQLNVALDEIKQALVADPNFVDAYNVRGLVYMDMGENRLAEENFQRGLRLAPNDPELSNNYGWFLCQTGQAAQSISWFENALKSRQYVSPAKALTNAGICSLRAKNTASAERFLTQAFQLDPGNVQTSLSLARVAYERADYERSRFYLGRVLKAEMQTAEVYWLAAKTERKLGDRLAEASYATQLRRRFPNSPEYAAYLRGAFDE